MRGMVVGEGGRSSGVLLYCFSAPSTTFKCLRHRNNYAARAPRLTRTRKVIRDSVQSSAGLLKVHIFRCFQKISLILYNSDIIFRITFIIKLQTS